MKAVVHKYKITTPQTIINVTYTAGVLTSIEVELAEDRSEFSRIAAQLLDEPPVIREGIVKELKVNSQQQKIALWCELYKMRYGIGYKVSVREANAVKNIDLTQKLTTITMNSKELKVINPNLPPQIIKERSAIMTRWLRHYGNDTPKRIPNNEITMQKGIAELRLMHLKATFPAQTIIGVIALQITDLQNFLNFKNKMSPNQILDTAEFILDDFEILSFTMIQDCFNRVKRGLPPFDKVLYQTLSGRKILYFLAEYDRMVDYELIDREHERKQLRLPAPENKQENRTKQAIANLHHQLGKLKEDYRRLNEKYQKK